MNNNDDDDDMQYNTLVNRKACFILKSLACHESMCPPFWTVLYVAHKSFTCVVMHLIFNYETFSVYEYINISTVM